MKIALTAAVFALTLRLSGLTHVAPGGRPFRRPVGLLQGAWVMGSTNLPTSSSNGC